MLLVQGSHFETCCSRAVKAKESPLGEPGRVRPPELILRRQTAASFSLGSRQGMYISTRATFLLWKVFLVHCP